MDADAVLELAAAVNRSVSVCCRRLYCHFPESEAPRNSFWQIRPDDPDLKTALETGQAAFEQAIGLAKYPQVKDLFWAVARPVAMRADMAISCCGVPGAAAHGAIWNLTQRFLRDSQNGSDPGYLNPDAVQDHWTKVRNEYESVRALIAAAESTAATPVGAPPQPQYVCRLVGGKTKQFEIAFGDEHGYMDARLNGAWYIYYLLSAPRNKRLASTELKAMLDKNGLSGSKTELQHADEEHSHSNRPDSTAEEIEYLQKGARHVAEDIEQARLSNDQATADQKVEELRQIEKQIRSLKNKKGKPRIIDPDSSTRVTVGNSITAAFKQCASGTLPKFAQHLKDAIPEPYSGDLAYRPEDIDPPPDWQFS